MPFRKAHWFEFGILLAAAAGCAEQSTSPIAVDDSSRVEPRGGNGHAMRADDETLDIGPEIEMGEASFLPAPGEQEEPAIAFDGENYLVVWMDDRTFSEPYDAHDIYGARVRASDGALVDPIGFPISTAASMQLEPAVAFDGENYLVVWTDGRGGDATLADIYAARVRASDGAVLDTDGIAISRGALFEMAPDVAFDGESYLIAWEYGMYDYFDEETDHSEIHGARLRASDGALLDTDNIVISTGESYRHDPKIVFLGEEYLVVWSDQRDYGTTGTDLYGARVRPSDGAVLDTDGIPLVARDGDQFEPTVATNGENVLLAWRQYDTDGVSGIVGTRVRGDDLTVLDTDGFTIAAVNNEQYDPAATSNGEDYFVVWKDGRNENPPNVIVGWDIFGARVDGADGGVLDPDGITIYASKEDEYPWQESPSVAAANGDYLVVWQDDRNDNEIPDIYGARVGGQDGTVQDSDGFPISLAENWQSNPSIAAGGGKALVVWNDGRSLNSTGYDIYGALIDIQNGEIAETREVAISTDAAAQIWPVVAYDGESFLVVWMDARGGDDDAIYGARIRASDGEVLDPDGFRISPEGQDASRPAVAFDGANYLVAYEITGETWDVYGVRVRASDGAILDPDGIAISTASEDQYYASVAYGGGVFFVSWTDYRDPDGYGYPDVYAARVRGDDGTVVDPDGIVVSSAIYGQGESTAVFDGTNFRIAWTDARADDGSQTEIYAARMHPNAGYLAGTSQVVSEVNDQLLPDLSFDGTSAFLIWSDQRDYETRQTDLYGIRLDSDGAAGEAFPISDTYWGETSPDLAFVDEGVGMLAYSRLGADGVRVVGRILEDDLWEPGTDTDSEVTVDAGQDAGDQDAGTADGGGGSCGCSSAGSRNSRIALFTLLL